MKRLLVLLLCVGGCALPDKAYTLDGVPVILENGKGPSLQHISMATGVYRKEIRERLALDVDSELLVWRSLREMRWTDSAVLDYAHFDQETSTLTANWMGGCALHVPLYEALTFLYIDEPADADLDWAVDLQDDVAPMLCTGSSGLVLPW